MKSPDDASRNAKLASFVFETGNAIGRYHFEISGLAEPFLGSRLGFTAPTRVDSARAIALQQAPGTRAVFKCIACAAALTPPPLPPLQGRNVGNV